MTHLGANAFAGGKEKIYGYHLAPDIFFCNIFSVLVNEGKRLYPANGCYLGINKPRDGVRNKHKKANNQGGEKDDIKNFLSGHDLSHSAKVIADGCDYQGLTGF